MNKYIKITASSNFGNICVVVCSSLVLPFYPITAIQILILNILYDTLCLVLPFDNVDENLLKSPSHWSGKTLARFMIYFGPISLIFDFLTFIFLYYVLAPNMLNLHYSNIGSLRQEFISIFQTGWFIESMWSQTFVFHMIRTVKIPFIQSRPSFQVILSFILAICFLTMIPFTNIGKILGFVSLQKNILCI